MLKVLTPIERIIHALETSDVEQNRGALARCQGGGLTVCALGMIALGLGLRAELTILAQQPIGSHLVRHARCIVDREIAQALTDAGLHEDIGDYVVHMNDAALLSFAQIARVLQWVRTKPLADQCDAIEYLIHAQWTEKGKAIIGSP